MGAGHVFVSYTTADRPFADELVAAFERRGLRIWYAPRDVRPGLDYSEQIHKAIETAAAFTVIVSEASNRSKFVRAETEMAFSFDRQIFPVRTSPVAPARGMALFLRLRHWTDVFGPSRQIAISRLGDELLALSQGPPPGSRRAGPTLFRPRWRGSAGGAPAEGARRSYAPLLLVTLGGVALIVALLLAAPTGLQANLQANDAAADAAAAPADATNAARPNYGPLRDDWPRDGWQPEAPPVPTEELADNGLDANAAVAPDMTIPDSTNDVNGM